MQLRLELRFAEEAQLAGGGTGRGAPPFSASPLDSPEGPLVSLAAGRMSGRSLLPIYSEQHLSYQIIPSTLSKVSIQHTEPRTKHFTGISRST